MSTDWGSTAPPAVGGFPTRRVRQPSAQHPPGRGVCWGARPAARPSSPSPCARNESRSRSFAAAQPGCRGGARLRGARPGFELNPRQHILPATRPGRGGGVCARRAVRGPGPPQRDHLLRRGLRPAVLQGRGLRSVQLRGRRRAGGEPAPLAADAGPAYPHRGAILLLTVGPVSAARRLVRASCCRWDAPSPRQWPRPQPAWPRRR